MIENGKVQTYTMLCVNYISIELRKLFLIKKKKNYWKERTGSCAFTLEPLHYGSRMLRGRK